MPRCPETVLPVQFRPPLKSNRRAASSGPRICMTAIRTMSRQTVREIVMMVLNLRRNAAPYMDSSVNRTTVAMLPIPIGMPNRE